MTLPITVTTNVDSKSSFAGVEKHIEHDKNVNHSNKEIDQGRTRFNRKINVAKYKKQLENQYGDFVKEHDKKMIETSRPDRVYGSVEKLIESKKGHPDARMITTFGNLETFTFMRDEMMKKLYGDKVTESMTAKERSSLKEKAERKMARVYNDGFEKYSRSFTKRNKNKMGFITGTTHLDEAGAPHMHAQIMPKGHTKKGSPSFSLNSALKEEFNVKDNREALKLWRAQEDAALLKSMEHSFKENGLDGIFEPFELHRTGNVSNVSMEVYKASQKKATSELKQERQTIKQQKAETLERLRKIEQKEKELQDQEDEQEAYQDNLDSLKATTDAQIDLNIRDHEENEIDKKENKINKKKNIRAYQNNKVQHEALQRRELQQSNKAQELNKKEQQIKARELNVVTREKSNNQKEKVLETREHDVNQKENSLNEFFYKAFSMLDNSHGLEANRNYANNNLSNLAVFFNLLGKTIAKNYSKIIRLTKEYATDSEQKAIQKKKRDDINKKSNEKDEGPDIR